MTDEQENVENKKDEKYKKNEKNGDKTGYYVKQPIFGTGKPSWLKQQFGKTVAIVVGALTCILFYFLLLMIPLFSLLMLEFYCLLRSPKYRYCRFSLHQM